MPFPTIVHAKMDAAKQMKCALGCMCVKGDCIAHNYYYRIFQIDQSQLHIYRSSFVDVESSATSSHDTGVLKYEYAIGALAM